MPDDNEATELKDIEVNTLGLVTRGANREDFFLLKEDGDAADANEMQATNLAEVEEKVTKSVWQKLVGLLKKSVAENMPAVEKQPVMEDASEDMTEDEAHSATMMEQMMLEETAKENTAVLDKGEVTMPDEISKAEFEKAQAELADIRKQLADAKEEKAQLVWLNKAAEFGYAPVASTELGKHLYAIAKLDTSEAQWLVDLLKSYDNMLTDSGLFVEKGTSQVDESDPIVKALTAPDTKEALLALDRKTAGELISRMREDARRSAK